ncbi:hypothetical protein Mapa_010470 [Marchantia paleacea]|nr:hypothetical protein Mapa_010470 [Marchantia paleacea]
MLIALLFPRLVSLCPSSSSSSPSLLESLLLSPDLFSFHFPLLCVAFLGFAPSLPCLPSFASTWWLATRRSR